MDNLLQGGTQLLGVLVSGRIAILPGIYLEPGQAVTAVQHTTAARCADDTPLVNTILVTGTTSGGINTTAQASLMTPVNTEPLPPQPALADTVYMGCMIQLAPGLDAAKLSQPYTMVVIVGPAPDGLLLYGVQAIQPYTDPLTLQAQTNALLSEGCNTGTCHPVRRMLIEQGKDIQITTIETIAGANQLFIPIVRR